MKKDQVNHVNAIEKHVCKSRFFNPGTANVRNENPSTDKSSIRRRQNDSTQHTTASRSNSTNNNTNTNPTNKSTEIWDSNSTDSICNSSISTILDVSVRKSRIHPSQNNWSDGHECRTMTLFPRNGARSCLRYVYVRSDQSLDEMNNADDSLISVVRASENEYGGDIQQMTTNRNRFKYIQTTDNVNNNYPRTKSYYKYKVLPWVFVKVTLDRLKLLALLDRNLTTCETMLSILLGILVSIFGAILLYMDFYNDLLAFIFCFVMASCQYSLLKSVQPDAASPTHGFNRIIAYSRPIYFCIISALILIVQQNLNVSTDVEIFYHTFTTQDILLYLRDFLIGFILFFPLFFSLGLFPQINTFVMYLLEQTDMHLFGGNAMSSLLASMYCIFRSILAILLLYGLAYGGLNEPKSSQHILYSMFCASLVACSYHLSRSASDPTHVWNLLKRHLWPPDIYREHATTFDEKPHKDLHSKTKNEQKKEMNNEEKPEMKEKNVKFPENNDGKPVEEHVDPLPHKLQKTVNARLKNDVILCSLIAILVFGIHASTVFTVLQPELSPVLWLITASIGFLLHYIVPQLRKQLPWLCIARPIFRSHEHEQYQIRGAAKIMWFERVRFTRIEFDAKLM